MRVLTDDTKDHVARYYNFIVVNNLLDTYELPIAVGIAVRALSGVSSGNETFEKKFIEEIDDVRQIWEEQPKYEITTTFLERIDSSTDEKWEPEPHIEYLSTYSEQIVVDRVQHMRWVERGRYKTITYKLV